MPLKAANYSARAGQTITGNLGRSASGRFVRAGSGGGRAVASTTKRPTPVERRAQHQAEQEQKRQEHEQAKQAERRANEAKVGEQAGLGKNLSDAVLEFDNPDEVIALNPQNAEELERKGLIERGADGQPRLSAAGRAYTAAARSGEVGRARDALSKGGDATAKRQAREERRAEVAARRQQRQAERATTSARRESKPKGGGGKGGVQKPEFASALTTAAQQLSDGSALTEADHEALLRNGLARLDQDGMPVLTAAGRRAIRQKSVTLPGALHIFKDTRHQWRWLAVSSTAFRDRDGEIVATKALETDCVRADQDGDYGPLRWWHKPTLNLGDCDFNGVSGRSLIESGTFRSEAIAQKVAAHAANLELSLGFYRRPGEPDADGVYHSIHRFERSLCPRGTASNTLTNFTVKESTPMALNDIKKKALAALGFGEQEIADLEAQAATKEKAAEAAGIAYKAETTTDGTVESVADVEPDSAGDFIGDMSPADFVTLLTPLIADAVASAIGAEDAQTTKAAEDTTRDQELQALQEQQRQLVAQQEALTKQQDELATRLKALDGDQPTGLPTGYRASQDASTILDSEIAKSQRPTADPLLVAADLILAT